MLENLAKKRLVKAALRDFASVFSVEYRWRICRRLRIHNVSILIDFSSVVQLLLRESGRGGQRKIKNSNISVLSG